MDHAEAAAVEDAEGQLEAPASDGSNKKPRGQPEVQAAEPPEDFQREAILPYDTERFPFLDALRQVLQEPDGSDLARLHETRLGREIVVCFRHRPERVVALGPRGNPWNRRYHSCMQREPQLFARFNAVYHDFLQSFVLDDLRTSRVAFQSSPTFRCHLPGCGAPGRPHRDEDYFHPRCEVNYWVPMTAVFSSNSLYVETQRGTGDFRPFELLPGRLVRFYGNQVWHYTVPNDTDCTRVSFDFRVIREQEWSPEAFTSFRLGAYYAVMAPSGLLPPSGPEMRSLQEEYQCLPRPKKIKSRATMPGEA